MTLGPSSRSEKPANIYGDHRRGVHCLDSAPLFSSSFYPTFLIFDTRTCHSPPLVVWPFHSFILHAPVLTIALFIHIDVATMPRVWATPSTATRASIDHQMPSHPISHIISYHLRHHYHCLTTVCLRTKPLAYLKGDRRTRSNENESENENESANIRKNLFSWLGSIRSAKLNHTNVTFIHTYSFWFELVRGNQ